MSVGPAAIEREFSDLVESSLLTEWLVALGFLALTVAMWVGHTSPASGYELSIYAATPALFWVGTLFAAVVGIWLSVPRTTTPDLRRLGYVLLAGSMLVVASIPVIRGYHFFGPADAMTHLGWARDIAAGRMSPFDLLYPGIHAMSVLLSTLGGLATVYSLEILVVVLLAVYVVSVPLVVRFLADEWWAVPIGLFAALFFLPINNVSVYRMTHPASLAILLSPFLLYLVFRHFDSHGPEKTSDDPLWMPTWSDLFVVLTGLVLVYIHPQIALSVVGMMLAISALQLVARARWPRSTLTEHRLLVGHTAVVGAVLLLWAPRHERVTDASEIFLQQFLVFFTGGTVPADAVASRGVSLSAIGGNIAVLFLKLFGNSLLLAGVATAVMVVTLRQYWPRRESERETYLLYATVAFLALSVGFLVYFLSSVTTQYFRQLGVMMVLVTVLAAAGVSRGIVVGIERFQTGWGPTLDSELTSLALRAVAVLFVVLLVVSIPNLYRSPYMYQASDQVPEGHVDGFEAAFDRMDRDLPFMAVRHNGGRYQDAIYGTERARATAFRGDAVPPPVFNAGNYSDQYDESRYLGISTRDRQRELVVYEGLRYERQGFALLDDHRRLNRVVSNRQVRVYFIALGD